MRKFLVSLLITMACGTMALAAEHAVTINWEYNPPSDMASFDLRTNGDNATIVSVLPEARTWRGSVDIADGNNTFEIRARDNADQVGEWTACTFNPVPGAVTFMFVIVQP